MKAKTQSKKQVTLSPHVHQQLKLLAAETGRKINNDLADDLLMLGIEDFRRAMQKNFKHRVTSAGYKGGNDRAE